MKITITAKFPINNYKCTMHKMIRDIYTTPSAFYTRIEESSVYDVCVYEERG